MDLYRDTFEASPRNLTPIHSPEVLTPVDLDALEVKDTELDLPTDVCKLSHIEHERPVLFHELISGSSASSSSIGNNNETLELPVVGEGSGVDSMPELEDETNLDLVKIPLWLIPNGVMVTFQVKIVAGIMTREQESDSTLSPEKEEGRIETPSPQRLEGRQGYQCPLHGGLIPKLVIAPRGVMCSFCGANTHSYRDCPVMHQYIREQADALAQRRLW